MVCGRIYRKCVCVGWGRGDIIDTWMRYVFNKFENKYKQNAQSIYEKT